MTKSAFSPYSGSKMTNDLLIRGRLTLGQLAFDDQSKTMDFLCGFKAVQTNETNPNVYCQTIGEQLISSGLTSV